MDEIINGKNLDSILEYCLEKFKVDNGHIFIDELQHKILPEYKEGEINLMLEYIDNHKFKVLDISC